MKTYKFYLGASRYFLNVQGYSNLDIQEKEYNHIASVLLSWIGLESYVNAISESLSKGTRLKKHEKSFLNEQELRVDSEGIFREHQIRPSTTKKILFIINRFSNIEVKDFKKRKIWKKLQAFEDLRNKIVHHKEKHNFAIDLDKASECRNTINDTIKYLDKLLFRKR